jgi:hypothetical protein
VPATSSSGTSSLWRAWKAAATERGTPTGGDFTMQAFIETKLLANKDTQTQKKAA